MSDELLDAVYDKGYETGAQGYNDEGFALDFIRNACEELHESYDYWKNDCLDVWWRAWQKGFDDTED